MVLPQTLQLQGANEQFLANAQQSWAALWAAGIDPTDIDASFERWLPAVGGVTATLGGMFGQLGNDYLTSLGLPKLATLPQVDQARFTASMHATGVAAMKAAIGRGETPRRAMEIGQSLTYGAFQRHLLNVQRTVIMTSAVGSSQGWRRVGHGGACDFCQMLIGRGSVYKQATASFAAHDRCHCSAEPALDDSSPWLSPRVEEPYVQKILDALAQETTDVQATIEMLQGRLQDPSTMPLTKANIEEALKRWNQQVEAKAGEKLAEKKDRESRTPKDVAKLKRAPIPGELSNVVDLMFESPESLLGRQALREQLESAAEVLVGHLKDRGVVPEDWKVGVDIEGNQLLASFRDQDGRFVGNARREFSGDDVHHALFEIEADFRGQGLATRFNAAMDDIYRANGIRTVSVQADIDVGGYTWAKAGFDWDDAYFSANQEDIISRLQKIERRVRGSTVLTTAERKQLREWIDAVDADTDTSEDWPTPYEIAMIGWRPGAKIWPGKSGMLHSNWYGIREL